MMILNGKLMANSWKFDCQPLHHVLFDPDMDKFLATMKVEDDVWYRNDPRGKAAASVKWGPYIEAGSHEKRDREYFAVKWSSLDIGFGLIALK
jgi:hypothetical protein